MGTAKAAAGSYGEWLILHPARYRYQFYGMKSKPRQPLSYEQARAIALRGEVADVIDLASLPDAPPEILYYLAENGTVTVRATVARNCGAPPPADRLLSHDSADSVREALAGKVIAGVQSAEAEDATKLSDNLLNLLETLCRDPLERIRAVLAESLKLSRLVPKSILSTLAHDRATTVSVPVVRASPQFIDADFVEILGDDPSETIIEVIALRPDIGPEVQDIVAQRRAAWGPLALLLPGNAARAELKSACAANTLDSERILRAVMAGNRTFVAGALAILVQRPETLVHRLLKLQTPNIIAALCWKAGVSAACCYHIQLKMAGIPPVRALEPVRGEYSLTDKQLEQVWDVYGGD